MNDAPSPGANVTKFAYVLERTIALARLIPELNIPRPVSSPFVDIVPVVDIAIPCPAVKACTTLVLVK